MAWLIPIVGFDSWQCCIYPQGTTWRVQPCTWGGLPWWRRFQALRYQGCYRTELLPSLTAEWLETSPPNTEVEGSDPRGLKWDYRKGYVGCWIYPEYSVAWLIPVVGFDSWQFLYCTVLCDVGLLMFQLCSTAPPPPPPRQGAHSTYHQHYGGSPPPWWPPHPGDWDLEDRWQEDFRQETKRWPWELVVPNSRGFLCLTLVPDETLRRQVLLYVEIGHKKIYQRLFALHHTGNLTATKALKNICVMCHGTLD